MTLFEGILLLFVVMIWSCNKENEQAKKDME